MVEVHECSGGTHSRGPHVEILKHPARRGTMIVSSTAYNSSNGSLESWFNQFIGIIQEAHKVSHCWRTQEGLPLCSGDRTDFRKIVVSIPVLLTVEFENFDGYSVDGPPWDFPDTLVPDDTDIEGIQSGLIYDLVGVVFFRKADSHFYVQYAPKPGDDIHEYDGLLRKGCPIVKQGIKFKDINSDYTLEAPQGSTISAVFLPSTGRLEISAAVLFV